MGGKRVTLPVYRCQRCGHEWVPKRTTAGKPGSCPNYVCRSKRWDTPAKWRQSERVKA